MQMFQQVAGLEHYSWQWNASIIFKKANVAAHQSGKAFKANSKLFEVHHSAVRKVIHKCKTLKSSHNHSGVDNRAVSPQS